MSKISKPVLLLAASALAVGACTAPNQNAQPKTTEGAIVGGVIGGILGMTRPGNKRENAAIGAVIGAAVGGMIGQNLDRQAEALRSSINNGEVSVVNTGAELIVTLPEAITFDTGSDVVRGSLRADLQALANNLNEFPDTTVDIFGHTDNVGDAGFNQRLSTQRADSVFIILANSGVSSARMRAIGRGEDAPIASNLSESGRAENRRVEIVIRPIQ